MADARFVPVQQKLQQFLATILDHPFLACFSLSASGINYSSLKAAAALKQLQTLTLPTN